MKEEIFNIIKPDKTVIKLELEIPETSEEYSRGLAFRDSIPQNTGMIYDYTLNYPYEARMWTPDTRVPVDFIFLDDANTIIKIHHNAKPLSEEIISCYTTASVIELSGGECERLNLDVGDILVFDEKNINTKFCNPKNIKGKFFFKDDRYFCKTKKELYQYSYRSHAWLGPIEDSIKWRFFERNESLNNFVEEYTVSEQDAKENCIKRDLELINDLKNNSCYYYRHKEDLFIKYDFEHGKFQYYSYIKGWIDVAASSFGRFLDMLRWNSIVQTRKETDEFIEKRASNSKKKILEEIDRENLIYLDKLKHKMYPYCSVFYKKNDDKIEGWKKIQLAGRKVFVEQICEKYKLLKNWKDFVVFDEGEYTYEIKDHWIPCNDFNHIHMTSCWLYNTETARWFIFPEEQLPMPKEKTTKTKKLEYSLDFDELDISDINEYEKPPYSISLIFDIKAGRDKDHLVIDYLQAKDEIKQFFEEVKTKKYAQLIIDEYSYAKFFFWEIDESTIRFQVQDWNNSNLKIPIDVIINRPLFLDFINNIAKELNKKEKEIMKKAKKLLKEAKKQNQDSESEE